MRALHATDDDVWAQLVRASYYLLQVDVLSMSQSWNWSPMYALLAHRSVLVRTYAVRTIATLLGAADQVRVRMMSSFVGADETDAALVECERYDRALTQERSRAFVAPDEASPVPAVKVAARHLSSRVADAGGILLPRHSAVEAFTPTLVAVDSMVRNMRSLAIAFASSSPILLEGETGAGKTALVEEFARLVGQSHLVKVHLGDQTDGKALLGTYVCTDMPGEFRWQPGLLTRAVLEGAWVLIEDVDLAPMEMMSVLLPLLESRSLYLPARDERINAAPGFALFGTRTVRHGSGSIVSPTSAAAEARWMRIAIESLTDSEIPAIVAAQHPQLVPLFPSPALDAFRAAVDAVGSTRPLSVRDLFKWCARLKRSLPAKVTATDPVRRAMLREANVCWLGMLPSSDEKWKAIASVAGALGLNSDVSQLMSDETAYKPTLHKTSSVLNVGRASLPLARGGQAVVGSSLPFAMTGTSLRLLEQIAEAVEMNEALLLVGETGTGKTTVVQQLAHQLGQELVVLNMSQQSESADLLGGFKPVDIRLLCAPLMDDFVPLFCRTFSRKKNQRFLDNVNAAFTSHSWSRLATLLQNAVLMADKKMAADDETSLEPSADGASAKRSRIAPELAAEWRQFTDRVHRFVAQKQQVESSFLFAFVEGSLLQAVQRGAWVLLDEINLAPTETLECLAGLFESPTGTLVLPERPGDADIVRHPSFRVFACMNPATDVGKRDFPPGLRSRMTELYVGELNSRADLVDIVRAYLEPVVMNAAPWGDIVDWYLGAREAARSGQLVDGENRRPHYSLRTLSRALEYTALLAPLYSWRRALYEGLCMSFMTQLGAASVTVLHTSVLPVVGVGKQLALSAILHEPKRPASDSGSDYVLVENFWIRCGSATLSSSFAEPPAYVLTPSVKGNLRSLSRVVAAARYPVLIQGPTSAGKTSMVEYLARLTNHRFVRVNNHEHTDLQEYLGSYVTNPVDGKLVFREGILVEALRRGYWLVLDELNLAPTDVLEALNRLLDDNRELFVPELQETIRPHPDFLLFATQNPPGAYGGRKVLSRAFRNRFLELQFEDLPIDELSTILSERCAMPPSRAKLLVNVYRDLQSRRQGTRIFSGRHGFITLRDLFRWGSRETTDPQALAEDGFRLLGERVRRSEERELVRESIEKVFKVKVDDLALYSTEALHADPLWPAVCAAAEAGDPTVLRCVWTPAMRRLFLLASRSLRCGEPLLIVGETGCGKTSVVQLLAAALSRPLHIVNCHEHTETADLLGSQRPVRARDQIRKDTQAQLAAVLAASDPALAESVSLATATDADISAALAGLDHPDGDKLRAQWARSQALFGWQDGVLVQAMRQGHLFLLDEMSLADDSVLERLNSVLEPVRLLVLAEKGGESVDEIIAHPNFHLFATMNPGGDHGKKELSPALRNRFTELWVPAIDDDVSLGLILKARLPVEHADAFADYILKFLTWIRAQPFASKRAPSLRDVIAWADFVVTTRQLAPAEALVHGCELVFLDGWSHSEAKEGRAMLHAMVGSPSDAPALANMSQDQLTMTSEGFFGASPFWIARGPAALPERSQLALHAPTTRLNAMRVLRALQLRKPILLEGPPGVGKTSLVQAIAASAGHSLVRINLSEQTDLMDLFGADLPVESSANDDSGSGGLFAWRDGPLLQALRRGAWVLLDELNLASQSVLEGLNACLDHRGELYLPDLDLRINVPPTSRIFAAQNPVSQGGGRKGLPRSFVNRFTVVHVAELADEDLLAVASSAHPWADADALSTMVKFTRAMHDAVNSGRLGRDGAPWEFNLRDILRWLDAMVEYKLQDPTPLVDLLFLQRLRTASDRSIARELFEEVSGKPLPVSPYAALDITSDAVRVGPLAVLPRSSSLRFSTTDAPSDMYMHSTVRAVEAVLHAVRLGWMALITGDAATGKSALIRSAATLAGRRLHEVALNAGTDTGELLGGFEQLDLEHERQQVLSELAVLVDNACADALCGNVTDTLLAFARRLRDAASLALSNTPLLHEQRMTRIDHVVSLLPAAAPLRARMAQLGELERGAASGRFRWVDGALIRAMVAGDWVLLDHANLCPPAVLDRLNPLMEPNGRLVVSERGVVGVQGELYQVAMHPDFRLFLAVDASAGQVSRAMRNRGVEICLVREVEGDAAPSPDSSRAMADAVRVAVAHGVTHAPSATMLAEESYAAHKKHNLRAVAQAATVAGVLAERGLAENAVFMASRSVYGQEPTTTVVATDSSCHVLSQRVSDFAEDARSASTWRTISVMDRAELDAVVALQRAAMRLPLSSAGLAARMSFELRGLLEARSSVPALMEAWRQGGFESNALPLSAADGGEASLDNSLFAVADLCYQFSQELESHVARAASLPVHQLTLVERSCALHNRRSDLHVGDFAQWEPLVYPLLRDALQLIISFVQSLPATSADVNHDIARVLARARTLALSADSLASFAAHLRPLAMLLKNQLNVQGDLASLLDRLEALLPLAAWDRWARGYRSGFHSRPIRFEPLARLRDRLHALCASDALLQRPSPDVLNAIGAVYSLADVNQPDPDAIAALETLCTALESLPQQPNASLTASLWASRSVAEEMAIVAQLVSGSADGAALAAEISAFFSMPLRRSPRSLAPLQHAKWVLEEGSPSLRLSIQPAALRSTQAALHSLVVGRSFTAHELGSVARAILDARSTSLDANERNKANLADAKELLQNAPLHSFNKALAVFDDLADAVWIAVSRLHEVRGDAAMVQPPAGPSVSLAVAGQRLALTGLALLSVTALPLALDPAAAVHAELQHAARSSSTVLAHLNVEAALENAIRGVPRNESMSEASPYLTTVLRALHDRRLVAERSVSDLERQRVDRPSDSARAIADIHSATSQMLTMLTQGRRLERQLTNTDPREAAVTARTLAAFAAQLDAFADHYSDLTDTSSAATYMILNGLSMTATAAMINAPLFEALAAVAVGDDNAVAADVALPDLSASARLLLAMQTTVLAAQRTGLPAKYEMPVLGDAFVLWADGEDARKEFEAAQDEAYRYRIRSHEFATDDELDEQRYRESFPTFDGDYTDVFMQIDEAKHDELQKAAKAQAAKPVMKSPPPPAFDAAQARELRALLTSTHFADLSSESRKQLRLRVKAHSSALVTRILAAHGDTLTSDIDAVARIMVADELENADSLVIAPLGQWRLLTTEPSAAALALWGDVHVEDSLQFVSPSSYDFYHDARRSETSQAAAALAALRARLAELMAEWPDHEILMRIDTVAARVQQLNLGAPVMRILTGVEMILRVAQDWELVASQAVSLASFLAPLTALVLQWRRLEVMSWPQMLASRADAAAQRDLDALWFHLARMVLQSNWDAVASSDAMQVDTGYQQAPLAELVKLVDQFILGAPSIQFATRLHSVAALASLAPSDSPARAIISNMVAQYGQHLPSVRANVQSLRAPIDKEFAEIVKLAKWHDVNYHALKASSERHHRSLAQMLRKFEEVLKAPALNVLQSLEAVAPAPTPTASQAAPPPPSHIPATFNANATAVTRAAGGDLYGIAPPSIVRGLGNFSSDIVEQLRGFETESNAQQYSEETKKIFSQLKSRKRLAYTSLLKTLTKVGLNANRPLLTAAQLDDPLFVLARPPVRASADDMMKDARRYFHRGMAQLNTLRRGARAAHVHRDINKRDLDKMVNFAINLLHVVLQQQTIGHELANRADAIARLRSALILAAEPAPAAKIALRDSRDAAEQLAAALSMLITFAEDVPSSQRLAAESLSDVAARVASAAELLAAPLAALKRGLEDTLVCSQQDDVTPHSFVASLIEAAPLAERASEMLARACGDTVLETLSRPIVAALQKASARASELTAAVGSQQQPSGDWDAFMAGLDSLERASAAAVQQARIRMPAGASEEEDDDTELDDMFIVSSHGKMVHLISYALPSALLPLQERCLSLAPRLASPPTEVLASVDRATRSVGALLEHAERVSAVFSEYHRGTCKTFYILSSLFAHMLATGLCAPAEIREEDGDGEGGDGRATFEDDVDGTGMAEGEGKKDVSDQIENEEQVLGTRGEKPPQEESDNGPQIEEEDNGLEMTSDFDGALHDVDPLAQQEKEEGKDGEDEGPEERMGDVDRGHEELDDKKKWQDDENPPGDDEDGPKDEEELEDSAKSAPTGDQMGPAEVKAKKGADDDKKKGGDDEKKGGEKGDDASKDGGDQGDNDEDDGGNDAFPEGDDGDADDEVAAQPDAQGGAPDDAAEGGEGDEQAGEEDGAGDLPDDMQLDSDEDGEGDGDGGDAMDIDGADEEDGDGEQQEDESEQQTDALMTDGDGEEAAGPQDGTADAADEKAPNDAADPSAAADAAEEDDGAAGSAAADEPMGAAQAAPTSDAGSGAQGVQGGSTSSGAGNATPQETTAAGADAEHKDEQRPTGARESATGTSTSLADQNKQRQQQRRQQQQSGMDAPNPYRSLSDAAREWARRAKEVLERTDALSDETAQGDNVQDDEAQALGDELMHVSDDDAANAVTLGAATAEQQRKQQEQRGAQADADESSADAAMDDDGEQEKEASPALPPMDNREAPSVARAAQSSSAPSRDRPQPKDERGAVGDDASRAATGGDQDDLMSYDPRLASRPADAITQVGSSSGRSDAPVKAEEKQEPLDLSTLRSELESDWASVHASSAPSAAAERLWLNLEAATQQQASELCESLRLLLEPTLTTKLRGDYRTGKRLHMRKVIPYIASQFRKDKIWLRRTKPAKRAYQILISVDDSRSMRDTNAVGMAFETVAVLAQALHRLEVGELGVLSFGERVGIVHPMDAPFSGRAGAAVIEKFTFQQDKTYVSRLLDAAQAVLEGARARHHQSADLWQLHIVVSDGALLDEDRSQLARLVRQAAERRVLIVFLAIDNRAQSIADLQSVSYVNGQVQVKRYLDSFPFEFFLLLRDMQTLPAILADSLRQWFELMARM